MNTKRRAHCQLWHDWKERIIRIGDEQTSLQNQFDNLRNEFTDNSPRLEALEAGVNALDGRLIIAETDIADAEDRISACEADIDRIDAELVDKTGEINALANRMSLAEADIDDIDARLEGIGTGEILLSQLNVDADKDWQGRSIRNVNLENVTVRGSEIVPARVNNHIILWDGQVDIEARKLHANHGTTPPTYEITDDGPHATVAVFESKSYGMDGYRYDLRIPVTPGQRLYFTFYAKMEATPEENFGLWLGVHRFDKNKSLIHYRGKYFDIVANGKWEKYNHSIILPDDTYYICPRLMIYESINNPVKVCGLKIYTDYISDSDLTAKNIAADAVIINDGGTVDGVDVSMHTHDGTAIGGPKISYNNLVDKPDVAVATHNHDGTTVGGPKISFNNLVDKPTVDISTHTHDGTAIGGQKISYNDLVDKPDIPTSLPKLPMPYRKTVSINLPFPESYIDILDIIPEGRTALTVEQLKYRSIANVDKDTGPYVAINIIFDDNTVVPAIDRISKSGDTDWHPPSHIYFYEYNYFTKNYIKGIRIIRSVHAGPSITGYVDILGHVY